MMLTSATIFSASYSSPVIQSLPRKRASRSLFGYSAASPRRRSLAPFSSPNQPSPSASSAPNARSPKRAFPSKFHAALISPLDFLPSSKLSTLFSTKATPPLPVKTGCVLRFAKMLSASAAFSPASLPTSRKSTASSRSWKFKLRALTRVSVRPVNRSCSSIRIAPAGIISSYATAFGPQAGLELVDNLIPEPSLKSYHLLPAVRGDLLKKLGRLDEARAEFARAASLAQNVRERTLLLSRAASCTPS